MQHKDISISDAQIKLKGDGAMSFEGYASTFGGEPDDYGDIIAPGAFNLSLSNRKRPVMMLFEHNPTRVIGKWLELVEDEQGLKVRGELTPGHTDAQNVHASLKHGALSGLSIGYHVPMGGSEYRDDVRVLKQVELGEVSVVSMPANVGAQVNAESVKSAIESVQTLRDYEQILVDVAGFTRSQAKAMTAQFKAVVQRDAEESADEEIKAKAAALSTELVDLLTGFEIPQFNQ